MIARLVLALVALVTPATATAPAVRTSLPAPPPPAPAPPVPEAVWDRVARCESGGQWDLATGNGYYGGLQFSLGSWRAVGGAGYPHQASRSEQITRANQLWLAQGWRAWPACSRKLGLR